MVKRILCSIGMLLVFVSLCYAARSQGPSSDEEKLTITTYYPSPYGSYNELEVHSGVTFKPHETTGDYVSNIPCTSDKKGKLAFGFYDFSSTESQYYYCDGTAAPSGWKSIGQTTSSVLLDSPITIIYWNDGGHEINHLITTGIITAGVTPRLPADAREILLFGTLDSGNPDASYIRYKFPTQTNWKDLVASPGNAAYPNSNSAWIPLNSQGRLEWSIGPTTQARDYRIEIQGYRK